MVGSEENYKFDLGVKGLTCLLLISKASVKYIINVSVKYHCFSIKSRPCLSQHIEQNDILSSMSKLLFESIIQCISLLILLKHICIFFKT